MMRPFFTISEMRILPEAKTIALGGVATGIYPDWQAAVDRAAVKDVQETRPREELYNVYSRYYQVYAGLYPDLADRYVQLWNAEQQR